MKKIVIALFWMISQLSLAQESGNAVFTFKPMMPMENAILSSSSLHILENKITELIVNSGSPVDGTAAFVIVPKVTATEQQTVEAMQKLTVVKIDLVLSVKNRLSQSTFAVCTKKMAGSGKTIPDAVANALTKFNPQDPATIDFIKSTNQKIGKYYEDQCGSLLAHIEKNIDMQNLETALAEMLSIPENSTCGKTVAGKLAEVYKKYQQKNCRVNVQQAKTAVANREYQKAAYYLNMIDRQVSVCESDYNQLVARIEKETSEEQRKSWEVLLKRQESNAVIVKAQVEILKSIVTHYYKNQHTEYLFID